MFVRKSSFVQSGTRHQTGTLKARHSSRFPNWPAWRLPLCYHHVRGDIAAKSRNFASRSLPIVAGASNLDPRGPFRRRHWIRLWHRLCHRLCLHPGRPATSCFGSTSRRGPTDRIPIRRLWCLLPRAKVPRSVSSADRAGAVHFAPTRVGRWTRHYRVLRVWPTVVLQK